MNKSNAIRIGVVLLLTLVLLPLVNADLISDMVAWYPVEMWGAGSCYGATAYNSANATGYYFLSNERPCSSINETVTTVDMPAEDACTTGTFTIDVTIKQSGIISEVCGESLSNPNNVYVNISRGNVELASDTQSMPIAGGCVTFDLSDYSDILRAGDTATIGLDPTSNNLCTAASQTYSDRYIEYSATTLASDGLSIWLNYSAVNYPDTLDYIARDEAFIMTLTNMEDGDFATGKIGDALTFDGSNEYGTVDNHDVIDSESTSRDLSICVWAKFPTLGNQETILDNRDGDNDGWAFWKTSADQFIFQLDTYDIYSGTIADSNWHLICAVIDRDGPSYVYLDGTPGNAVDFTGAAEAMDTSADLRIGRDYTTTNYAEMSLDEVYFYREAISTDLIDAIYNSGSGNASIGNNGNMFLRYSFEDNEWPTGVDNTATYETSYWVYRDDADGGRYDVMRLYTYNRYHIENDIFLNSSQQYTITFWAERNSAAYDNIIGGDVSQNYEYVALGYPLGLIIESKTNGDQCIATLNDNDTQEWHHYAVVVDENQCTIYQDGVELTQTDEGITDDLYISCIGGTCGTDTKTFNGQLDDLMIFDAALTSTQINNIYTAYPFSYITETADNPIESNRITPLINYTFKDEVALTDINGTLNIVTDFISEYSSLDQERQFVYTQATARDSFQFAVFPNVPPIYGQWNINYNSDGYQSRNLIETYNLSSLLEKTLYLVETDVGSYATFITVTGAGTTISDVNVTADRYIAGEWVTVASGTTDGAGSIQFWLNPDYQHRITFVHPSYTTLVKYINPTAATYTIEMGAEPYTIFDDALIGMSWTTQPIEQFLIAGTTYQFNATFNSTLDNIYECQFMLINSSGDILDSDTGCEYATYNGAGGSITLTLAMPDQRIWGNLSIRVNATDGPWIVVDSDATWHSLVINTSGNTLKEGLTWMMDNFEYSEETAENSLSRIWAFFLIFAIVIALVTRYTGEENRNPMGIIILIYVVVLVFSWASGFYVDSPVALTFMKKYGATFTLTMIALGFIFNHIGNRWGGERL